MFKVKWVKFFPHRCLLLDVILNEVVNKLTRRKHFLRQKFLLTVWEMSVCKKCKHYSQGFIYLIFVLWGVKVEVKVIGQSMWKCTWCRVSYIFFFFSDLRMFIGLLEYFDLLSSVYNSNVVWFFILSFKYFEECFGEFFALQLLLLTQSLAPLVKFLFWSFLFCISFLFCLISALKL